MSGPDAARQGPADVLQPPCGWGGAASVRLEPPAASGLAFRSLASVARLFGRAQVPDLFTVLHRNPRLFWAWLLFASRLMPFGRLPAAMREKIILRTAWNCRSRYEWGQHVDIALRAGVSDADILRVASGHAAFTDPVEQALMRACDELCRDRCMSEATWAVLAGHHDEKRLIEIMLLVGHYEMVAGFLNSTGLVLEPAAEAILQDFHRRIAAVGR